jgi:dihydroneopterin aldolase
MVGALSVSGIACEAIIGVLPEERLMPQPLRLGFSIWLDFSEAVKSNDLSHSVDYAALTAELKDLAVEGKFQLLETLAAYSAEFVLAKYPRVRQVEITCLKPNAIPGSDGAAAVLRLERK